MRRPSSSEKNNQSKRLLLFIFNRGGGGGGVLKLQRALVNAVRKHALIKRECDGANHKDKGAEHSAEDSQTEFRYGFTVRFLEPLSDPNEARFCPEDRFTSMTMSLPA
jgi:hypothetical protein